ncbi:protocatechuate 3,4-dioxygenase subunit alpha [Actinomadura livida]|uniref:Protocatechuate 3,4-dioxygenase alpha subunit n=1 Tax=Actinomadura livida TaxID=79909 RepID=A0A7W7IDL9_9ACTN|nr:MULTISPECIES: protocatechuate 3,4-dioxygenase subunit alpha [Actinomadura]MBB4775136.1 protocatechuate 3,4-dioxygenase alpha subunit [Actinomadura catellatispora]GGT88094.1 protocatechuate 3,4-dioxygenase subunit alpha [Actinomadura livida]
MTTASHDGAPGPTPSQTVGPFFGYALPYETGPRVVPGWRPDAIDVRGRVLDGAGEPVPDALLEIWQADESGRIPRRPGGIVRDGHDFSGFGRCGTDADGAFWFTTVKPGAVGDGAPCIAVLVFARGLLKPVFTRLYFPEDETAHAADPLLGAVPAERRATLIAAREGERRYRFDIRLQGDRETVFLGF